MNIIRKLFSREATVKKATQPVTEQLTEAEIQARLAAIDASETDFSLAESEIAALQLEKETLMRRLKAMRDKKERRDKELYQARNKAARDAFLSRRDTLMMEVNTHVTGLMLALPDVATLANDAHSVPWTETSSVEEIIGVPTNFAQTLLDAIREAAPNTEWDFSATGPGKKAARPKLKGPQMIRAPRFAGDTAPPPGFTGTWNTIAGRPMEESDYPLLVLPNG